MQRDGKAQKWSFASAYISRRRKRIYVRYCMEAQHQRELGLLRGPTTTSYCLSEEPGNEAWPKQVALLTKRCRVGNEAANVV